MNFAYQSMQWFPGELQVEEFHPLGDIAKFEFPTSKRP